MAFEVFQAEYIPVRLPSGQGHLVLIGQVVAKGMSPARTKAQQGGPAGPKVISPQTETHIRGKRNRACCLCSIKHCPACSQGQAQDVGEQTPKVFHSVGEVTPGPPTTLENNAPHSPPTPWTAPHTAQPLPRGRSSTARLSSSRGSPPVPRAMSKNSTPAPCKVGALRTQGVGKVPAGTALPSDG